MRQPTGSDRHSGTDLGLCLSGRIFFIRYGSSGIRALPHTVKVKYVLVSRGRYLSLAYDRFFPHPSQFIIYYHSTTRRYT